MDRNGDGDTVDPGETGDLRWSNPGNWSAGVPSFGDDVVFPNSTPPVSNNYIKFYTTDRGLRTPHSVMDISETISSLTIRGPGPNTGGGSGWLIVDTIKLDPIVPGSPDVPLNLGTIDILGLVAFSGTGTAITSFDIDFNANAQNVSVDAGGTLVINGGSDFDTGGIDKGLSASGPVGILKLGGGTLTLNSFNTFDGLVELPANSGTVVAGDNFALGTTGSGTVVRSGSTLQVATGNLAESLQIQGTGAGGVGALTGGGEVSGGVALTPSATISGGLTISGVVSGAGDLTTSGSISLTNANTYLGVTFVSSGFLTITHDDALSPGSFTVVANGATLNLSSGFFTGVRVVDDEMLFLNGLGSGGVGALLGSGANRTTPAEWRSRIFLENAASVGVGEFSGLQLTGQLANLPLSAATLATFSSEELDAFQAYGALGRPTTLNASLTKLGKGDAIFPNANLDFFGDTFVTDGTLLMRGPEVLGPATSATTNPGGSITVNFSIPTLQFGTLEVQGRFPVAKNLILNGNGFNSQGALHLTNDPRPGAATPTVIDWTAPLTLASPSTISTDFTTGLTLSGVVGGGLFAGLQKNGTGSLTITNNNTFLGSLGLRDGVTTITNNGALGGAGGDGTAVASGATLVLADGLTILGETLTLSSEQGTPATLQFGGGTNLWSGLVNMVGNNQIGAGDEAIITGTSPTGTLEFSNVISGDAKLRKTGTGEIRLTGMQSNTFTDALQIDGGTVLLAKTLGPNGTIVNAVAGPIIVGDGLGGNNVDVLRLGGPNQIPNSVPIFIGSSGLFNLNGFVETIGPLSLQGGEVATGAGSLILTTNVTTLGAPDVSVVTGNLFLGNLTRTFNFLPGPSVSFSANVNPAQSGRLITFSFTVAGNPGDPVPTGTVNFFDGNIFLGSASVNGAGTATFQTNSLSVGSHTIRGEYSGDGNYSAQSVTLAQPVVVVNPSERVALTSNASPSLPGQAVTFTFSLAQNVGDPVPTGTVTFFDGLVQLGAPQSLSGGTASVTIDTLSVGAHTIRAVYSGDTTYAAAEVTLANQRVGTPATLTLSTNANPAPFGTPLTFTFTAAGRTGDPIPDGSVEFFNGTTSLGVVPLSGGTATLMTSALPAGTNQIRAVYSGDNFFFLPGTVNLAPSQVVGSTPLVQLKSSANQSVQNTNVTFTFTALGDIGDPNPPAGSVQFRDNGAVIGGPVPLTGGTAGITLSTLTVGSHTITAEYIPAVGSPYRTTTATLAPNQLVTAIPNATTLLVQSSNNSARTGENVTFTFRISVATGGAQPTGTVTFRDITNPATPIVIATGVPLAGSGGVATAATSTAALLPGVRIIEANYSGDANYGGGPVLLNPQQRIVNPLAASVGTSANPSLDGSVTLTYNWRTDPSAPPLVGTVTFFDGGNQIGTAQNVNGNSGSVSVTATNLAIGTHSITAVYTPPAGPNPLYASQTATLAPALVVGTPPSMLLSSNSPQSTPGNLITFSFAASGNVGAPIPTGTVQFFSDGTPIGSPVNLNLGTATRLTNSLAPGFHVITASYSGDANYAPGTVTLVPNQVVLGTPRAQLTSDANPVATGANVTFTFNLTRPSPANPQPVGMVQFFDNGTPLGAPVAITNGVATLTTNTLTPGAHTITALFTPAATSPYQSTMLTFSNQVVAAPPLPPLAPPPTVVSSFSPTLQVNGIISGGAGAGVTKAGSGQMILNGLNTYSGPTTVNGNLGSLVLGVNNALPNTPVVITAGTLDVNGKTDSVPSLSGAAAGILALGGGSFTVGSDNTSTTFAGAITGGGRLTKVGTGTLTLSGASPLYTGTTAVAGGTVLVNGAQGGAAVTVAAGTTLGGTGTVGAVTLTAGGTLAPGTSVGTLNSGPVTFNGGTFAVELSKVGAVLSSDLLAVTGTVATGSANPILLLNTAAYANPLVADAPFTILTTTTALPASFRFRRADGSTINDGDTITINGRAFTVDYGTNSVTVEFAGLQTVGTFTVSSNPSSPGATVQVTVTFAPAAPGDAIPTGTVMFTDSLGGTTFVPVSTALDGSGRATTSATFTTTGAHLITATFTADPGSGYMNTTAVFTQTVNIPTTTTVFTSNASVRVGDAVTFTATVGTSGGVPTGTITFVNANTGAVIGTAGLDGAGRAVFTTTGLPVGTFAVRAVYSGDATFRGSSATISQTVVSPPPFYTNAFVIGSFLVLEGNGVPGGLQILPVPTGTFALFTDINGDAQGDVILFLPNFIVVLDGQTGKVALLAADTNGDGFQDIQIFNADGTTTTTDGRTGITVTT